MAIILKCDMCGKEETAEAYNGYIDIDCLVENSIHNIHYMDATRMLCLGCAARVKDFFMSVLEAPKDETIPDEGEQQERKRMRWTEEAKSQFRAMIFAGASNEQLAETFHITKKAASLYRHRWGNKKSSYDNCTKADIELAPGTKTHHRWTEEEDDFIKFHSAGMTNEELARKFGVTLGVIQQRKSKIL